MYDVVIIGAGPAGLSASLWCNELGLSTIVLEQNKEIGGQLLYIYNPIDNFLGRQAENGIELCNIFSRQLGNKGFDIKTNVRIKNVDLQAKHILIEGEERIESRSIIIATGVRRRRLDIPGEIELIGRGIIESGARDRAYLAGKDICIVGGGDATVENALRLAEVCSSVTLVHRSKQFRARKEFLNRLSLDNRIKVNTEAKVLRIIGETKVEGVEIIREGEVKPFEIAVSGVLIRIGVEPNVDLFKEQLELDRSRYIKVSSQQETSIGDVFAIGDVSNPIAPTISSAIGSGATAAKVIYARLNQ
jgi:thioredoxin reductase (NADPH)